MLTIVVVVSLVRHFLAYGTEPIVADSLRIPNIGRISGMLGIVTLLIASVSGCSHCRSTLTAFSHLKTTYAKERRARATAKDVWDEKFAEHYYGHSDSEGLRAGFVEGFVASCMDGGDCPPLFAPNQDSMFQHGKNTCSTAWHNGYPIGSAEAAVCGYQEHNCARAHPCLRDVRRPVNPGCIRISDQYLLSDNRVNSHSLLTAADAELNVPFLPPLKLSLKPKVDSSEFATTAVVDRLIPELDGPRSMPEIEQSVTTTGLGLPELLDTQTNFATEQFDSKTVRIHPEASHPVVATDAPLSESDGWRPVAKQQQ